MKILLDAFGGDNSPLEVIKGAVEYIAEGGACEVCLVGMEDVINKIFEENGYSKKNISIMNATEIITCHEAPTTAFKQKPDSTITVGLNPPFSARCPWKEAETSATAYRPAETASDRSSFYPVS